MFWVVALCCFSLPALAQKFHGLDHSRSSKSVGDVSALYDLLDRVLAKSDTGENDASSHFVLKLCDGSEDEQDNVSVEGACSCSSSFDDDNGGWFCMEQQQQSSTNDDLVIMGTSVSEISYGIGHYFRYYCNFTVGWERIGGSVRNLALPDGSAWPVVPQPIRKQRRVPWSYLMNVCTHSYSLVWYDWESGWEPFLDWASLMGINNLLALTGQEEIQYKVYQKLGLNDEDIRSWFNGPAFLTWSRGQNEYGSGIAGPLPRSWMQQQWELQKDHILPRLKELAIVGQLPGFQGNTPIQLSQLYPHAKMTKMGDTGWLDALDPLYAKIADLWMSTLVDDFGRDMLSHWYQMDGYLNGGVPPWMTLLSDDDDSRSQDTTPRQPTTNSFKETKALMEQQESRRLRSSNQQHAKFDVPHDSVWYQRGVAAYTGLNRTDPNAVWSFQGFSFIGWNNSDVTASWLKGFVDSAPPGRFVIIDMSYTGLGEWTKWNNASYFGADFIWSALHNFGDTNGLKGDMNRIASILPSIQSTPSTSVVGIGATPEGIDQNPVYYEFLLDQAFHGSQDESVPNATAFMVERSHRRYGACSTSSDPSCSHVTEAWQLLAKTSYATDQSVQDTTGVAHRNPRASDFKTDRCTPNKQICSVFRAWKHLIRAATVAPKSQVGFRQPPFEYDLINLGREVLAQLSAPMASNFSDALAKKPLDATRLLETGNVYIQLLEDLDRLLGSHAAFLVGPWIQSARAWGKNGGNDCHATAAPSIQECSDFYEWNARVQITTWNPTSAGATKIPGGPIDYAAKHWSGLCKDYYAERASLVLQTALANSGETGTLNQTEVSLKEAQLAFRWTTALSFYPTKASEDPLQMSVAMERLYGHWFDSCDVML
ncbi:Alpha-N-acetylglucosaminidase (NAGLU) tim-barrel domain [Seminavis robusta]|uniref:Alpha-N-acetylglucosaminidase (NAGLU) tim-barrel domain n=1 Tax=Seminavis robusta TaxID=568900 RepID=A0A9N8HVR0_9STRA|nr:Alpha-N-acetylglucosaminidase (NAGLU) tim-barrel domain [Seminavis robusta]|eukprot:Sro1851_g301670.1 Alpha-N-acetylglucosaminidase (NAGLU) tim-barrel domain (879) ;mRNA; r:15091-17838